MIFMFLKNKFQNVHFDGLQFLCFLKGVYFHKRQVSTFLLLKEGILFLSMLQYGEGHFVLNFIKIQKQQQG